MDTVLTLHVPTSTSGLNLKPFFFLLQMEDEDKTLEALHVVVSILGVGEVKTGGIRKKWDR
jgi:hypothetical protein